MQLPQRLTLWLLLLSVPSNFVVFGAKKSRIGPTHRFYHQDDQLYHQLLDLLQPLSPCRQKIRQELYFKNNIAISPLAFTIIRFYFKVGTPILLDTIGRAQFRYTSKYQIRCCSIQLHFINKPRMSRRPLINPLGISIDKSYGLVDVFNKHDDIFLSFVPSTPWQFPEFDFSRAVCHFPLNLVVFQVIIEATPTYRGYIPVVTLMAARLGFRCPPKQWICLEDFSQYILRGKSDYGQLSAVLNRRRSNMHGSPIELRQFNAMPWYQLRALIQAPIRLSYKSHLAALAKRAALQIPALEFNFTIKSTASLPPEARACLVGTVESYTAIPPHFSLARPYVLEGSFNMRALYCQWIQAPRPFKFTSLKSPIEDKAVWVILLVLTALFIILVVTKAHGKSLQAAGFAVTTAFCGATSQINPRAEAVYAGWLIVTWYMGTVYTSVLQSILVAPAVREGPKPIRELIFEDNYTTFCTRQSHIDKMKLLVQSTQEIPGVGGGQRNRSMVLELEKRVANSTSLKPVGEWNGVMTSREALLYDAMPLVEAGFMLFIPGQNINCLKSPDEIFHTPQWMSFYNVPSSDLMYHHYIHVEGTGILQHWRKVIDNPLPSRKDLSKEQFGILMGIMSRNVKKITFEPTSMNDSTVVEILTLGQVGALVSTLVFLLELIHGIFSRAVQNLCFMVVLYRWKDFLWL